MSSCARVVHGFQCGGIAGFLAVHLADLAAFGYEDSPFEVDARAHEVDALPVAPKAS